MFPSRAGTRPEKIRLQKWYTIYKDHITLEVRVECPGHERVSSSCNEHACRTTRSTTVSTLSSFTTSANPTLFADEIVRVGVLCCVA
jgi:hypothetical protein